MLRLSAASTFSLVVAVSVSTRSFNSSQESSVAAVLDDWHKSAAAADEARYFSHFTADAVMMGTDASERWTRDQFQEWAKPHFAEGKGWSFHATVRHVSVSKDGSVAWFDEALDTAELGPCRSSGVMVREADRWKIAQYNLSVPIPNEVFTEVKKIIDAARNAKREKQ